MYKQALKNQGNSNKIKARAEKEIKKIQCHFIILF